MKNAEMKVVKFSAEDVIATSCYTASASGFGAGEGTNTITYNGVAYVNATRSDLYKALGSGVGEQNPLFVNGNGTSVRGGNLLPEGTYEDTAWNGSYTWDSVSKSFIHQ